jgi:hypothetical protein
VHALTPHGAGTVTEGTPTTTDGTGGVERPGAERDSLAGGVATGTLERCVTPGADASFEGALSPFAFTAVTRYR